MADSDEKPPGSAKTGTPGTPKSPPSTAKGKGSKPGSAKSASSGRAGSAKTPAGKAASRTGSRSPTPASKGKKSGKKKSHDDVKTPDTPTAVEGEEEQIKVHRLYIHSMKALPEGCIPIFLASKTQELFDCRGDEDVTEENPYKFLKKEDIQKDLFNRAAVCDFHPIKKIIEDYPGEEILIGFDADFKFGQNFFIATTEEAKELLMRKDEKKGEEGEEGEEAEDIVYKYIPPEPKEWVSLGSEKELAEEVLLETRNKVKTSMKRMRREFGSPCVFSDRNVGDAKDGYIECVSYEDKTFELKRIELTKGTQAIPDFTDSSAQTDWAYPRNAAVQYSPRSFTEEEREKIQETEHYTGFIKNVAPRFELALQQNEVMDVFYDDWVSLADKDSSFGSKADNHLKEYQSFTDLQFSKEKTVTCIDWHPSIRGVVAVAIGERLSFDERIDHAARVIMTPSLVLIWSFADPIHPQLLLEAPDDILCFKFCPTDPNIIAGGCMNGQVVLWDISQHAERLKAPRGSAKKKNTNTLPGFEDKNALDTPIVRYCAVSSIEYSHRAPVTDLLWVPDHYEVTRMGVPQENKSGQCVQIMTAAIDHMICFWDTRPPKTQASVHSKHKEELQNNPMGVPTTFKHLDLSWKPHLKVTLSKSEPGGDHSPTKFSICEIQGDKSVLSEEDEKKQYENKDSQMGFSFGKPGSAGVKRTLTSVKTHFYVGTEDGEIVYTDWMPQKDQDSGKIQTPKPDYYHIQHDGPVVTIQRSPFFRDIILCIGGWTFSIWKEGVTSGPIVSCSASGKRLTAGYWSPSRPGVFYITRHDGSVDIWDLLDRTHEPSMNQSVSPSPITCIFPYAVTSKQHLLAVGDDTGTLHILEIPWSLRQPTPNEMMGVSNYFDREVKRREFVMARWDFREKEKMEIEHEAKAKAGIAPNVVLTDEEIEHRMKQEYQAFLEEEATFLRELGLKEEVEEELPQID